jgi:hypothetical protein
MSKAMYGKLNESSKRMLDHIKEIDESSEKTEQALEKLMARREHFGKVVREKMDGGGFESKDKAIEARNMLRQLLLDIGRHKAALSQFERARMMLVESVGVDPKKLKQRQAAQPQA